MTKAIACLLLAGALAYPQDLSVGKVLVASRKSQDADFAQTVILLVRHDTQATIGLFVNRPLNIPMSEVYPELKGGQLKLYAGGPVTVGIRALYRSRVKPENAAHIFDDVFMISTKALLGKMVQAGTPSSVFRVYAGYTGWSPGQLKDEIGRGLWHVFAGDASVVFDPHPETVWSRLIGPLPRAQ
jgi:putative transcriptional regulator